MPPEENDRMLMAAAGRGDRRAFEHLMERHARFSMSLARRLVRNEEDANEIVQEAFLRVWKTAPRWQADGSGEFKTWLYRIILNLCIDHRRKPVLSDLSEETERAGDLPDAMDECIAVERNKMVMKSLDLLPERQKQALSVYYFGGVTAKEAADILGLSLSALESILVRGRRKLRDNLKKLGINMPGDLL